MRLGVVVAIGVAMGVAVGGCGGDDGADALGQARAKTLAARYVALSQPSGRELFLSSSLTVIKQRRRVSAWMAPGEEYTLRSKRRCYERHTEFSRDDVRQQRENIVPVKLDGVSVGDADGVRVVSGRVRNSDFADTEYELRLDASGRVHSARQRSAEFGAIPAGSWETATYRYPAAAAFGRLAGPRPQPRCREHERQTMRADAAAKR